MKPITLLGDPSSHGGTVTTTGQDGTLNAKGNLVCVNGAMHACPITGHGTKPITAITVKSFHNGKLILTAGAVAGCGAVITSPPRTVFVE